MVVIDSLKLAFLTGSNAILFFAGKTTEINEHIIGIYKTAGYCLDYCFASCENSVWISFKRMYGKLLPPPPPSPSSSVTGVFIIEALTPDLSPISR